MLFLRHKERHIVVADLPEGTTDLGDKVQVLGKVGFDASIQGVSRRGRPPVYDKPVPSKDLEIVDGSTLPAEFHDEAAKLLGVPDAVPAVPDMDEDPEEEEVVFGAALDEELELVPMDAE